MGHPHLPHLLTFWSTNFNITYGYWILCRERNLLSVVEISFIGDLFLAVCFLLGTTSVENRSVIWGNSGLWVSSTTNSPLKVRLTHISPLIRRPSFTPVNALGAMILSKTFCHFAEIYIFSKNKILPQIPCFLKHLAWLHTN